MFETGRVLNANQTAYLQSDQTLCYSNTAYVDP